MQDAQAVESHNRAERATAEGRFKDQIVPVMLKSKKGEVAYATDEHFRAGAKMEDFSKLKPVFLKENGTVTAGNASGINDAAAAVVLMEGKAAQARGLKPMARLVGYAHTGLDPKIMGVGPISATQAVLKRTGLSVNDLDVIEANEAFAAQACAVTKELGLDPAKVKYVIVSHAHAGEVGGAYLFQSRYGSKIVMNDWDMADESVNGFPTGVEVCHAMQHGGPAPATSDARFTSVGSAALERFIRPVCYQDVPDALLPPALRDGNPLGIERLVEGVRGRD